MDKETLKKTFKAAEATVAACEGQQTILLAPQRDSWSPVPRDNSTETAFSNTMRNMTACSRSPAKKRTNSPFGSIRNQKSRARTNIRRADTYSKKSLTAVDKPTSGVETAAGISSRSASRISQMGTAIGSSSTTSTAREDSVRQKRTSTGINTAVGSGCQTGKTNTALGISSRSNSRESSWKSGGAKTAVGQSFRSGSLDNNLRQPTSGVNTAAGLSSRSGSRDSSAGQPTSGVNTAVGLSSRSVSRASQMRMAVGTNFATSTAREDTASKSGKWNTAMGNNSRSNSRGSCIMSGKKKKKSVGIRSKGQPTSGVSTAAGRSSRFGSRASRKKNTDVGTRARSASRDSNKPTTGVDTAVGICSRSNSQVSTAREQISSRHDSPPPLKTIHTSMSSTPVTSTLSTAREIPIDIAWSTPSRLGNTTTSSTVTSKEPLAVEKLSDGRIKLTMMMEITAPSGRIGIAARAPEGTKVKMVTVNGTMIYSA